MITVALSTTINAPADRVWRALSDPAERVAWDERVLGAVSSARGSASRSASNPNESNDVAGALKSSRWRFRLGRVPLVMQDDLITAEPNERMVNRISIGSMQFVQTLTLYSEDDETGPHTRLGMKLVASNSIAVLGELIPRLDVQKIVIEFVDTTLRQIQKHCEC